MLDKSLSSKEQSELLKKLPVVVRSILERNIKSAVYYFSITTQEKTRESIRIGGLPEFPSHETWPTFEFTEDERRKLTQYVQIPLCKEYAAISASLPSKGSIHLYSSFDVEVALGIDSTSPPDQVKGIIYPEINLVRPSCTYTDEDVLAESWAVPVLSTSFAFGEAYAFIYGSGHFTRDEITSIDAKMKSVEYALLTHNTPAGFNTEDIIGQFGGHAIFIHDNPGDDFDPPYYEAWNYTTAGQFSYKSLVPLFQFFSNYSNSVMYDWGDGGVLYWMLAQEALDQGKVDAVMFNMQSS